MRTESSRQYVWPLLLIIATFVGATLQLRYQGRLWWCACGQPYLWTSDAWSSHNSQHLFDPYSFTHLLHGFAFYWLVTIALPRLSYWWQLAIGTVVEGLWEVIENTEFVIQRYRETTAALGYSGDSIANSLGDVLTCVIGFMIALRIGFRRSALAFAVTEVVLLLWIKDSLLLEILMLIYPIDAIKAWQLGQ
ncbi:MAG TPA: DUF2585 family protein [Pyrinomonadaceae bacterium]|nr:DUF2585 family protein [Pyrinomonadaceae bacterium]